MDDDLSLNIVSTPAVTRPSKPDQGDAQKKPKRDKSRFKKGIAKKRQRERGSRNSGRTLKEQRVDNYQGPSFAQDEFDAPDPVPSQYSTSRPTKEETKIRDQIQDNQKSIENEEFVETSKKRVFKENEKKGHFKKKKFEDLTKMNLDWKDSGAETKETPSELIKRDVISAENFEELPLEDRLKKILENNGYNKMTKIQKSAIPVVLQNNNVLLSLEC